MKKLAQIAIIYAAILLFLNLTFPAYAGPAAFVLGTIFLQAESRITKENIRLLLYRLAIVCLSTNLLALISTLGVCRLLQLLKLNLQYCDYNLSKYLFGISVALFLLPWVAVLIMALGYKLLKKA